MNNTTTTTLDQLKKEYETASKEVNDYADENQITDFFEGDQTYLNLLLKKHEAYKAWKQAETPEFKFNTVYAPVINNRLQRIKNRIHSIGGSIL